MPHAPRLWSCGHLASPEIGQTAWRAIAPWATLQTVSGDEQATGALPPTLQRSIPRMPQCQPA